LKLTRLSSECLELDTSEPIGLTVPQYSNRIGFARLTNQAFDGIDLRPVRDRLIGKITAGTAEAGDGLDLSLITQLLGDKETGLAIQSEVLAFHQLFRSPCAVEKPALRVLALAAAIDMGGNTPIEFLLEGSDIELLTLYVINDVGLPEPLPDHDVAIVIASDSEECREALSAIARAAPRWPRPLLNHPSRIAQLDRDKLHRLLHGIEGLEIPATYCVPRSGMPNLSSGGRGSELRFPIIARPRGSHAGVGLARLDDAAAVGQYLLERQEEEFFVSRFVDYASADGLYRKYRIAVIDGQPFACHMAIADRWDIWYLNAGMALSQSKRDEEASFMRGFDGTFASRHRGALTAMIERIGLDYFTIDCAENKHGELLIFEVDNTAVVHNMDSPELYPYKQPQIKRIFAAFAAMLVRRHELQR
jgi:hypothetical protein